MKIQMTQAVARSVADAITNHWLMNASSHEAMRGHVMALVGGAKALDCPECEICCAIGVCCPLGSEQQRATLATLLYRGRAA